MPDFSRPGSDGELPADYIEWERGGVVCTVRSRLLSPLRSGEVYRINVQVQRAVPAGVSPPAYAHLYEHATAIANARATELACPDSGAPIHTWILSQEWFGIERLQKQKIGAGIGNFAASFLTIGLMCVGKDKPPHGESVPTPDALRTPRMIPARARGEATAEQFAAGAAEMKRLDEIYKDVEVGEPSPHVVLFSYGESVPTDQEVDFAQVVERAEQRAKWHHDLIARSAPAAFSVVKRQWWCSDPAQVVVHVYSRDLVGSTVS